VRVDHADDRPSQTSLGPREKNRAVAELAIGHQRVGLERLYNFNQAWQLHCEAFAKVSDHVAELLGHADAECKVVAIPTRT
jgi:hypothetical protein